MTRGPGDETERIRTVYSTYAGIASKKWSPTNHGNAEMVRERNARILDLLQQAGAWPLRGKRILDIGCGGGDLLSFFEGQGARSADLFGVDLLPERIEAARQAHPHLNLSVANGERLSFANDEFDLVTLFLVFSSILDDGMTQALAREVERILRPGGCVLVYDFRVPSPTNRNTRAISRGAVAKLFPGASTHTRTLTVLPPLTRRMGRATSTIYPLLAALPFLRTHNLILLHPSKARG